MLDFEKLETFEEKSASLEQYLAELKALDTQILRRQRSVDAIGSDIAECDAQITAAHARKNEAENDLGNLQSEANAPHLTHEQRDDLAAQITEKAQEIETCREEIAGLQAHRDEREEDRGEEEKTKQALVEDRDKLLRSITAGFDRLAGTLKEAKTTLRGGIRDWLDLAPPEVDEEGGSKPKARGPKRTASGTILFPEPVGPDANAHDLDTIKIQSSELESRIMAILDHLTARRIAEEMDTDTYIFRLRMFFERADVRAKHFLENIAEGLQERLKEMDAGFEKTFHGIQKLIDLLPDAHFAERKRKWRQTNKTGLADIRAKIEQVEHAVKALEGRMQIFRERICKDGAYESAVEVGGRISKHIEDGKFLRWWPLLVASLTTLLTKMAISLAANPFLTSKAVAILMTVFVLSYLFSRGLGLQFRAGVMDDLQENYRDAIKTLFSDPDAKDQRFRFASYRVSDLIKAGQPSVSVGDGVRQWISDRQAVVVRWNVVTIMLPLFLGVPSALTIEQNRGFYGLTERKPSLVSLQTVGADGNECLMSEGILTHETAASYFIFPATAIEQGEQTEERTTFDKAGRALQRAFPEFWAHRVAKANVHLVRARDAVPTGVKRCDDLRAPQPADPLTVVQTVIEAAAGGSASCPQLGGCGTVAGLEALRTEVQELRDAQAQTHDLQRFVIAAQQAMRRLPAPAVDETVFAGLREDLQKILANLDRPDVNYINQNAPLRDEIEISGPLWEFRMDVDNQTVFEGKDEILLTFFPVKIEETDNLPQNAFRKGRNSLNEDNEVAFDSALNFYLNQIVRMIRLRMHADDEPVGIEVLGFASEVWNGDVSEEEKADLNHALAEGRRHAVIAYLKEKLKEDLEETDQARISISGPDLRNCQALNAFAVATDWSNETSTAFAEAGDMENARAALLESYGVSDYASFRDFAARSVRVRLTAGSCAA